MVEFLHCDPSALILGCAASTRKDDDNSKENKHKKTSGMDAIIQIIIVPSELRVAFTVFVDYIRAVDYVVTCLRTTAL